MHRSFRHTVPPWHCSPVSQLVKQTLSGAHVYGLQAAADRPVHSTDTHRRFRHTAETPQL
jgi:hypothetical protein